VINNSVQNSIASHREVCQQPPNALTCTYGPGLQEFFTLELFSAHPETGTATDHLCTRSFADYVVI